MEIIRINKQSNWTDITHSYVVDMLHNIVQKHGSVCIIVDGGEEQKIVNLNRISYVYTSIKIHFAAKKILKILTGET